METNYITLKKRSMMPADPALTWDEMNENFQTIEDTINELIDTKINQSEKAAPSGVATLNERTHLLDEQCPELIDGGNF